MSLLPVTVVQRPVARTNYRAGHEPPRPVQAIVLHITEGDAHSVDAWFNDPAAEVSAHFMVLRDGTIHQYVGIHDVAYHAGQLVEPTWPLLASGTITSVNAQTVGIEHEGHGAEPWTADQVLVSATLSAWLAARFRVPVDSQHFPKHHEIKATKPCPGPWFNRDAYLGHVSALSAQFQGPALRDLVCGIR